MDLEEIELEQPVEDIVITIGCFLQLRGSALDYEELLILKEVVQKGIDNYDREVHRNESQELNVLDMRR